MSTKNLSYGLVALGTIALFAETSLVNFPFIFFLGAALLILIKSVRLYAFVFFLAFATDALRVSNFGLTPLFLAGILSLIFLYERYSGSSDLLVAGIVVAASGFFYARLLTYSTPLTVGFYIAFLIGYFVFAQLRASKKVFI